MSLLLSSLCVAGFCVCVFYILVKRQERQDLLWEQEQRLRDEARCKAIEEGLLQWLKMLGLPQLGEEKRLQEAAHQLRIVLVEQLMRGPRVS